MTDKDKCARAAELFYQNIQQQIKKDPDYTIEDMRELAYQWAMNCGFDHPKCFVEYIDNIENQSGE